LISEILLEARRLKKYFEFRRGSLSDLISRRKMTIKAVDDVDLEIDRFTSFGIVGESGSGKSTLARTILRLEEPTSGRILFLGRDITKIPQNEMTKVRREMQIVFQNPYWSLNPRKTVIEIVSQPLKVHKESENSLEKVFKVLKSVGLDESIAYRYPHELSGGQRQRVAIARAIVLNPKFVVLDEVTSALDVSMQAQILKLLKMLQTSFGLSYLFISHDLSVVRVISDKIGVMYSGKIIEEAPADLLFSEPLHPYTQALLAAVPLPHFSTEWNPKIPSGEPPNPANPPEGCRFHPRCHDVKDICRNNPPPLIDLGKGHMVACHLCAKR
jgi:oligopeptide/dipeptide ABC transporter ATP-binding protein